MSYLLLMALGGSILLIGYLIWERLFGKFMTQYMGYIALITVLLTFLVPWIWVKGIYRLVLFDFWDESDVIREAKGLVNLADIRTQEEAYRTADYKYLMIFASLWFIGATIVMIIKVMRYIDKRRALSRLSIPCGDENLEETVKRLQKELGCKHRPKIVWTRVNNKTFTLGVVKPIIFLQKDYADGELYWILKHEMTHIVKRDLLIKMVLEFASCLYWFNPFIYVLAHKVEFVSEASCDELVLKGCSEKERKIYIQLLDKNKDGNRLKIPFGSALENGNKDIDKRIKLLKEAKKISRDKKLLAMSVFGLLVFIDSLTVFAYPRVRHVEDAVIGAAEDAVGGDNFLSYDYVEEGYGMPTNAILYNEQFVDGGGQVFPILIPDTSSSCTNHDIISGYYQKHIENDDGSCIVETYKCTKCVICDMVWIGDFYFEDVQVICEHGLHE